jgi:hypothetical protein
MTEMILAFDMTFSFKRLAAPADGRGDQPQPPVKSYAIS